MELFLNIVFLILGMVFLIKGADIFVDGASTVAKLLKVPTLIIGLTIVALGTSLPELAVSVAAAISKEVALSVGNVVGSNIFNILVVLGLTAILIPITIEKKVLKFELPYVIGGSLLLMIVSLIGNKEVTWYIGIIFLILLVVYIVILLLRSKKENNIEESEEEKSIKTKKDIIKAIIFLILGAASIIFGGECVKTTAVFIADFIGMDEKLIALTIVALGTSLPELVTSIVAAKKGENDIALGNVIGSNTLNILFILGISGIIEPLPASGMQVDMIFMLFVTILLFVMAILTYKKKGIFRISGIILVSLYVLYTVYLICRELGVIS